MKCFALILVLVVVCQVQATFGEEIDQFLILSHPLPYKTLGFPLTDPYRALEDVVCDRWLTAIPSLSPSTFVIQLEYSQTPSTDQLLQSFINRLGAGHVLRIDPDPAVVGGKYVPGPMITQYEQINQWVHQQMAAEGLTFNPTTANTAIWGESFEGCASGYGSGIASYLGLQTPTTFDYSMTVPDAPFLLNATFLQTVPVPGSDVEAYVFDLNDGQSAAFFRSTLTPQWLDHRPIDIQLNSNFSVTTKQGIPVWQGTEPRTVTFTTWDEQYLVTTTPNMPELLSVIDGATVDAPQAATVRDTFTRVDGSGGTAADSIGNSQVPVSTYHWYESDLVWDNSINAADIQNGKVRMLANGRQVTLDADFQDVNHLSTEVTFDVGEGTWPASNAAIFLRKGGILTNTFAWTENPEKVCVQFAPSGYMTITEGDVVIYSENPWTGETSWQGEFGAPGALPTTVNGLPFDENQDGRIAAAETSETIILGVSLVGTDLTVTVNGLEMWAGTLTYSTSSTGNNYISLGNNVIGGPATVTTYFDDISIYTLALLDGDANRDGVVSAGDYASVQANFGATGNPGIPGDANGDGVVSAGDYASVQANFGSVAPVIGAIPEPATICLLFGGGLALLRRRK